MIIQNRPLLIVKDRGGGFNLENVRDPVAPGNLLVGHGRGLFLIAELTDEASVGFETGTEIYMRWGPISGLSPTGIASAVCALASPTASNLVRQVGDGCADR